MPSKTQFPDRPLNRALAINRTVDPNDVFEVKTYLTQKGFYDVPDYGLTPYPDEQLFDAIKKYQADRGLTVDGIMKVDGETQESMRVEKEELPPPIIKEPLIPGTNIPDHGVPEQGWPGLNKFDPFDKNYEKNKDSDPTILRKYPYKIDSHMPTYDSISPTKKDRNI